MRTLDLVVSPGPENGAYLVVPGKDERPALELGAELFAFLFPGQVREHYGKEAGLAARDDEQVRIQLLIRPPELAALPWEFLYDPHKDDYLSLTAPLVRYPEVPKQVAPLTVTGPVRVLGMISGPGGLAELDVEHEKRWLDQSLAGLADVGQVELTWVDGQTWRDLRDSLDRVRPNVLHFIGHGGFDDERGEGLLALAREDGGMHRLMASDLALLIGQCRSLRLVVLNSCEGARASAGDVFSSTAALLTRRGVPAVVAMQYEISDDAAITFARGLYGAIARGLGVDQAVTSARLEIKISRTGTLEWATPVLYLRSPDAHLFDLTSPAPEVAATSQKVVARPQSPIGSLPVPLRHEDEIWAVAFSPNGTRLATGSGDGTARIWDASTGRELHYLTRGGRVFSVAYNPDGTRLATGSADHSPTASIWDADTGREITRLALPGLLRAVAYSPDGRHLATSSDAVQIWDATTGREIAQLAHDSPVYAVAYSPDGGQLATGCADGTARIWAV